ncbi:hypothetical protein [Faecalibacter rhinopitheci]|uniref:Spi protease inhibitor domain-containing protein n=1 Tax=Faecalibacter rhinopitheci TaxID=2779678 RepID=A0A8J7G7P7_9FLAO|nr:hypothetical protein [Faecalibacter rhinopitheci]MBF0598352.1 hypothetical protein [Faecalibacter rhinopitheci]
MLKKILLLNLVLSCSVVFSQEETTKNGLPKSSIKSLIDTSNIEKSNVIDLQTYIEDTYVNSSKYYNKGALPIIKKGEYYVLLIDENDKKIIKKSSDFKDISPSKIKEFTYEKSVKSDYLGGYFGAVFGVISIKLRK